jgi:microcystin-dependent protein
MADPFVAEIRIFPFNFAPRGWAHCDGQLLPLSQNTALFALLGTMYGGNGKSNFALPNLQGSAPMHPGQGQGLSRHDLGETGGSETVTLIESELPAHTHAMNAQDSDADLDDPVNAVLARPFVTSLSRTSGSGPEPEHAAGARITQRLRSWITRAFSFVRARLLHRTTPDSNASTGDSLYKSPVTDPVVALAAASITPAGGSQPHNNLMPYLTLNFCIALEGVFPPRG